MTASLIVFDDGGMRPLSCSTSVTTVLALALVLVACSGSDGADATTSSTSSSGVDTTTATGAGGAAGTGGGEVGGAGGSGVGGEGGAPWTGVPTDRPLRLLFLGNSFTHQGPIPHLVRDVAASVGWPAPEVVYNAPGGQSLDFHRNSTTSVGHVDDGNWDAVVLQDFSTRPTDNIGDPAGFKNDATWFYDRIKAATPTAEVILYETWARHPDHGFYPNSFSDPLEMQAQLRTHYHDAADNFIPQNATFNPATDVRVAPVGDAWENHLAEPNALRLHGGDDYHAGFRGQYLNALVLYATIYGVVATGAAPVNGVSAAEAQQLQAAADATTGITQLPPTFAVPPLAVGQTIQVDFGPTVTADPDWNGVNDCTNGGAADMVDDTGATTGVDLTITEAFTGANSNGEPNNGLGYPSTTSDDVCWVGSFDGHAAALLEQAVVVIDDLDAGTYEVVLFASRTGDDGGNGRLTRFTYDGQTMDLEAADNTSTVVTFSGLIPDASGRITLTVDVSPAGAARFGYLGALILTKTTD